MDSSDRVAQVAREVLSLGDGSGRPDLWLWEHSQRVARSAVQLRELPDFADAGADADALELAGLFANAGWAVEVQQGKWTRWQTLSRPTTGVQRELGAALLEEKAGSFVAPEVLHRATEAIRECNDRFSERSEAQILAEAENLVDIGVVNLLRQFRQYQAEGRTTDDLIAKWQRQKEYRYWEARINDCLRTDSAKQLARQRLQQTETMIDAIAREGVVDDLRLLLSGQTA